MASMAALLAACGDDDEPAVAAPQAQETAAQACDRLQGMTIAAADIGLPTTGAKVESTTLVAAAGTQPEYCKVTGHITPVDTNAASFQFAVGLPSTWNGKALHQGGGGYNGTLVQPDKQPTLLDPNTPTPLTRGYATFGSDGGHQDPTGAFALNDETFGNYAGAELKKTRDVAMAIIRSRYGKAPTRTYFAGFSEGGREALVVAQRYPADYDGVIVGAPVYSLTAEEIGNVLMFQKHYAPGGLMTAAKMTTLKDTVMSTCDGLDGVADGIVSAPNQCQVDPATLRCPGGADTGDGCLSDGQIATVNAIGSRVTLNFTLENGVNGYEAYPILKGSDLQFGTRATPTIPPAFGPDPALWAFGDTAVRWFIVRDGTADLRTFNPDAYQARIQQVSRLGDATTPDLDAFRNRGGKLLMTHGAVDQYVSPGNTTVYYQSLEARYGASALRNFAR
jgi:feruloyl esterase